MTDTSTTRKNRLLITVLFLLFLAPILASTLIYHFGSFDAEHAKTRGVLVHPARPVSGVSFSSQDGQPVTLASLQGKWTLLYLHQGDCGAACQKVINDMTVTRLALGEDSQRLKTTFVVLGNAVPTSFATTLAENPSVQVLLMAAEQTAHFEQNFTIDGAATALSRRSYLVDPFGNFMMYYPADADPKGMLQDLLKLMKASRV